MKSDPREGRHRTLVLSTADVLAATGIRTLRQLHAAENELERYGLISLNRRPNGTIMTLLDPDTGDPLQFARWDK